MTKRVALITNATQYAGPGSVAALLHSGFIVMCHDKRFCDDNKKRAFETEYPGVFTSNDKTPDTLVKNTMKQCGQINLLVSNDIYPLQYQPIGEAEAADMREALEALLIWPFCLLGKVANEMKRQQKGHIVFITSAAPNHPEVGFSIYSSVRASASVLAKAAARELAPYHITVNAIAPNYLESEIYYPRDQWINDEAQQKLQKLVPIGRLGRADEIGALIAFLASGSADFITGEVINFTGGWS